MSSAYDAVVVGAGPNGLVAANHLADAGWSVLVLEEQPEVGGAVRSDTEVHPGFVHDTFSAFYPLAAVSPAIRALRLEEHGLHWEHAPAALGHPRPDGSWALIHRDREVTAALAEEQHAGDGEAWLTLCREWDVIGEPLLAGLLQPFPPLRAVPRGLWQLRKLGGARFLKTLLTPATELARQRFGGAGPQLLLCGNAGHTDIPVDSPGSGLMGLLMSMLAQSVGFPVPRGGAGQLSAALRRRLEARGGEVRVGEAVHGVGVEHGRARHVHAAGGSVHARRAVVAAVTAVQLFGGPGRAGSLVPAADVPRRVRAGMRQFTWDPATVKVDWALSGPVPWAQPPPHSPGTVHVADDVADLAQALGQVSAGLVPARPFLLAGQMTTSDPTRSPAGTESMWAYTHVPQHVGGDAGGEGLGGRWDHDECERFADRVQARLEAYAPGFGTRVLARRVLGPTELESRDANLVGGALNGGTSQLHQELALRPVAGLGRAETGVPGLYLASASAHPGGGVHGAAGHNAARAALAHDRLRRALRRS
ncbi:NAD(P)/FAD-dependent oxidoreductase [Nocardioides mangrovicus]|uniref:NAD(P)/FAD-dependent oxidoreductase n=1 Tax=Nocardioides mangrovicus TaxID=2478913 RepID=A0A3L8NZ73_9ACTN|nr:NAD(P)/FAD-dependent oxidoreductase [Nocardioides mangrovicus]RLV48470.1 NAD(P)/FAD-dependent oxidoreductase [Nocardioides mangrovicus]